MDLTDLELLFRWRVEQLPPERLEHLGRDGGRLSCMMIAKRISGVAKRGQLEELDFSEKQQGAS